MASRELGMEELGNVVGGVLEFDGKTVYVEGKPEGVRYNYSDKSACQRWLAFNWNGPTDERALEALKAAGLVW